MNVKSHGMTIDLVEPTWMMITIEEIEALLLFYPQFKKAEKLVWHSPRPFSSAVISVIDGKRYFIKRHAQNVRNVEGLLEEHGILHYLQTQGLPVSKIVEGVHKQTAFSLHEWTYEIHALGSGIDLYKDAISWSPFYSEHHAYSAGKTLASMHVALKNYTAEKRKVRPLVSCFEIWNTGDPIAAAEKFMIHRPGLANYLNQRKWKEDFQNILFPYYKKFYPFASCLDPIWTHNDWHASNLLWTDQSDYAEVSMILDFGLSNVTSAVFDLATAIERNIVEWLAIDSYQKQIVHYQSLKALLAGYLSIRPLTQDEQNALVTILPIVHTDYALSEIDYFVRMTKSQRDADLAYDDYLLGHAKWFQTEEGKKLLQKLKEYLP